VAQCITRTGRLDAMTAEALAAVFALRFCTVMGLTKICLEGDAKLVVRGCY
jgi:ribonuclease HI